VFVFNFKTRIFLNKS